MNQKRKICQISRKTNKNTENGSLVSFYKRILCIKSVHVFQSCDARNENNDWPNECFLPVEMQ